MKTKDNNPFVPHTNPGDNSKLLSDIIGFSKDVDFTKTDEKSDDDFIEDINNYFAYCINHDMRPGIGGLCLAMGITETTFNQWERGLVQTKSDELALCLKKARQIIGAYYEQLSINGKLNPAMAIFLLKNWFGYTDTKVVEVAPSATFGKLAKLDELEKKYLKDLPEPKEAEYKIID